MSEENNFKPIFIMIIIICVIYFLLSHYVPHKKEKLSIKLNKLSPRDSIRKACPYKEEEVEEVSPGYSPRTPTDKYNNPNPRVNVKKYNNDFFKFRDFTEQNSSIRYDAVDKINNLTLSGELSKLGANSGAKIKDIYDALTSNDINLYKKPCVRLPFFDDINPDGYSYQPGTPGMQLTPDDWNYNREKVLNGGQFMENIVGNDPNTTGLFDLWRFNKAEQALQEKIDNQF